MKDFSTHFYLQMPEPGFSVDIFLRKDRKNEMRVKSHWHENIQLFFLVQGHAFIECGKNQIYAGPNSIVVINSNELHYMKSLSDDLTYYIIRFDPYFLFSNQVDLCQTKYIAPLSQNLISFNNLIENDNEILNCVNEMIREYFKKEIGYELSVKSYIYQLIVILMRGYINNIYTKKEISTKVNNLKRFELVFQYIELNYNEKILISDLSEMLNITTYHFCRLFKQLSGKTVIDYINNIRLEKAIPYLKEDKLNITEIALKCGFDDINYFSRIFKKYYNVSPTKFNSEE